MKVIFAIVACLGLFVAEAQAVVFCSYRCNGMISNGKLSKKLMDQIDTALKFDGGKAQDGYGGGMHTMLNREYKIVNVRGSDRYKITLERDDKTAALAFLARQEELAKKWSVFTRRPEIEAARQIVILKACVKDTTCDKFNLAFDKQLEQLKGDTLSSNNTQPYWGKPIQNVTSLSHVMVLLSVLESLGRSDEWLN